LGVLSYKQVSNKKFKFIVSEKKQHIFKGARTNINPRNKGVAFPVSWILKKRRAGVIQSQSRMDSSPNRFLPP